MKNVFVERKPNGNYAATHNKKVIATGGTQAETIAKAHKKEPDASILAERVRDTKGGSRDKWRKV
jgi:hypothetical protein